MQAFETFSRRLTRHNKIDMDQVVICVPNRIAPSPFSNKCRHQQGTANDKTVPTEKRACIEWKLAPKLSKGACSNRDHGWKFSRR